MSILDIVKANGVENLIDESSRLTPELTKIPSFPMKGVTVRSVVFTGQSNSTGSFRQSGTGTAAITEVSEQRDFNCFTSEPRIEVDRADADRYEDGPQAWIGGKTKRAFAAEMLAWAKQMYYGSNADGFPGLVSIYDRTNMEYDAGGTTANTGSSIWLIRAAIAGNKEDDGCRWRYGENGKLSFDPVALVTVTDPADPTKKYKAYETAMTVYPGLQVQSLMTVVRIKKVTADSGKGATDALINKGLSLFPAGKGPNLLFYTKRSAMQHQLSRTATNPKGEQAPWPLSVLGMDGSVIPIYVTEALSDAESLTL